MAEIAVIVLYYKWWRSTLVLFPPLLLATVYAFGIASLPPFDVSSLNSNTAFLGSIIIGNGINVGIVLLARYREARRAGATVDEAVAIGTFLPYMFTREGVSWFTKQRLAVNHTGARKIAAKLAA